MDRRDAIKKTAFLMGVAVSASTITAVMSGCKTDPSGGASSGVTATGDWKPSFFNNDQINTIADIADRIIPETDTPGAKAANVHQFIDGTFKDNYEPDVQKAMKAALDGFMADVKKEHGKSFTALSPEEQDKVLTGIEAEAMEELKKGGNLPPFFTAMKELTCIGFFRSEIGATQTLQYSAVPGDYLGCISLEEAGGKTWAT